jgi:hypothetical protein
MLKYQARKTRIYEAYIFYGKANAQIAEIESFKHWAAG